MVSTFKAVVRFDPFHAACEVAMNPLPVRNTVVVGPEEHAEDESPLAVAKDGDSADIAGVGLRSLSALLLVQPARNTSIPATSEYRTDLE